MITYEAMLHICAKYTGYDRGMADSKCPKSIFPYSSTKLTPVNIPIHYRGLENSADVGEH